MSSELSTKGERIGSSGYLLRQAGLNLYLDPGGVEENLPKAHIVCLSAADPKGVRMRDVVRLSTPETIVVGLPSCVSRFRLNQLPIRPGESRDVLALRIEAAEGRDGSLRFVIRYPDFDLRYPE